MLLNFNLVLQSYKILKFSTYLKPEHLKYTLLMNSMGVLDILIKFDKMW